MAKYSSKTKDDKCIFCEIVNKNIPSYSFWEDDNFLSFLAIDPNTEGVTCVIPKVHYDSDPLLLPDEILSNLIIASKKVALSLKNYYSDVGRVGFIIEGLGINHFHLKLYPMHETTNLKNGLWEQQLSNDEIYFNKYEGYISSIGGPIADFNKLKELGENIKKSIQ